MSIFPTKILLATDASKEASLAATTAADLAKSTGSELHVLHVGAGHPLYEASGVSGITGRCWRRRDERPKGYSTNRSGRSKARERPSRRPTSTSTSGPTGRSFT
jgi:Universal stress protein family